MAKRIEEIILKVSIKADKANSQIAALNKRTQQATEKFNKFGQTQDKINNKLRKRPTSRFWHNWITGTNKATAANKRNSQSMIASSKSMSLLKGGAIIAAAVIAQKLGAAALDVAVKFDRIDKAMETVFGSTGAAAKEMDFLRKVTDDLGLSLSGSADGFIKIAASAKGTTLEGQGVKDIFLGVAQASTALALSSEQSKGALLAISQIMSKGKVQAEELRGQLGERIPGAFQIAARAMGVTTSALDKMLERGELLSEDFLPKFAAQMKEEFAGGAVNAADSIAASQNRLSNEWERSIKGMGDSIGSFIGPLASALKMVNDFSSAVGETVDGLNIWRDALLGIEDDFGKGFTEEQLAQFKLQKLRTNEARKQLSISKQEAKEQGRIADAAKKVSALQGILSGLFAKENADKAAEAAGLTAKEYEKLGPAMEDAFRKGAKFEDIVLKARIVVASFPDELNKIDVEKIVEKFNKISGINSPFNQLIKDATLLQEALSFKADLGLTTAEFEKVSGTIAKAIEEGVPLDSLKANIEGLRELGFFKDLEEEKAQASISGPLTSTFQVGTAAASEFLKTNEVNLEQLDVMKKIEKNTKNRNELIAK